MKCIPWFLLVLIAILGMSPGCASQERREDVYRIEDFLSVPKIDAHVHIRTNDSAFAVLCEANNFRALTLSTDEVPGIDVQNAFALQQLRILPGTVRYVTTFSATNWADQGWTERTIADLTEAFSKGAVAVKLYKNIGMELTDSQGKFIMISDSIFDPVIDFIAQKNIPLIGHFGEPKNAWLPIEKMTIKGDQRYFTNHPEFHMHLYPSLPSYEDHLKERDEMLGKHPELKFVGAHLGSLEWSLEALSAYLDKYPNASVDLAARVSHLEWHTKEDWQKTRDFFIKYQDRLIYGTDLIIEEGANVSEMKKNVLEKWMKDWTFFCSDERLVSSSFTGSYRGLRLPKGVINKLYCTNAENLFLTD